MDWTDDYLTHICQLMAEHVKALFVCASAFELLEKLSDG
jgi:hypothetical protein